jgi:hypothetical protein
MAYQGIVTTIATEPHPNADRIKIGKCHGFTVIIGLDTPEGALGVYFPEGGRFSPRMLTENKLLKSQGGYFDESGRIRAQKFRGVKSEGIWLPIGCLNWANGLFSSQQEFKPGDLIDKIGDELVCEKYFTPATLAASTNQAKKQKKGETPWFKKQGDTPQLRFVIDQIPDGALIYFTEKLHGTSGRYGLSLETVPNPWWRRMLRLSERVEWRLLVGSKNVILSDKPEGGYYKDESFRFKNLPVGIRKGETLYYEIVGYTSDGAQIMGSQPVKDPELKAKYGPVMTYKYGQLQGESKIYVYRITQTNEDGDVVELSWPQVKGRCKELGVEYCPDLHYGPWYKNGLGIIGGASDPEYYNLQEVADSCYEGSSMLDSSHIREGVVLRIEEPNGKIWFTKHKSYDFKVLEGIIKEDVNYVDREEIA